MYGLMHGVVVGDLPDDKFEQFYVSKNARQWFIGPGYPLRVFQNSLRLMRKIQTLRL
jgi:hypothetical protein